MFLLTFFPSQILILARHVKNWNFSIFKIETLFPLCIYTFLFFFPSAKNPNFGVFWENMGLDPPPPLIASALQTK